MMVVTRVCWVIGYLTLASDIEIFWSRLTTAIGNEVNKANSKLEALMIVIDVANIKRIW